MTTSFLKTVTTFRVSFSSEKVNYTAICICFCLVHSDAVSMEYMIGGEYYVTVVL